MKQDMRALSRTAWVTEETHFHAINCGSMLRMADSVEKIARGYTAFEQDAKSAKASRDYWRQEAESLKRQLAAQRGVVTKLRKRLQVASENPPESAPASSTNIGHPTPTGSTGERT